VDNDVHRAGQGAQETTASPSELLFLHYSLGG
jgi:hypothetical protein